MRIAAFNRLARFGSVFGVMLMLSALFFSGSGRSVAALIGVSFIIAFGVPATQDFLSMWSATVEYTRRASDSLDDRVNINPLGMTLKWYFAGYDSKEYREGLEKYATSADRERQEIDETLLGVLREEAQELGVSHALERILDAEGLGGAVTFMDKVESVLMEAAELGVHDEAILALNTGGLEAAQAHVAMVRRQRSTGG